MKQKKILMVLAASAMLVGVVGCNKKTKSSEFENPYAAENEKIGEGYTSLKNQYENNALTADGKYEYAGQTFKTKNVFKTTYVSEPTTFNYLTSDKQQSARFYCNMVDGLVENDKYGNIVGAIAKSYKIGENAAGKQTFTFELKKGVYWVNNDTAAMYKVDGKEQMVTAHDFVAGLKYVLDPISGSKTTSIVTNFVDGAEEYLAKKSKGEEAKFDELVGIKAIDDFTLEYTLAYPAPYFLSALTYSPYLPVSQAYLDEVGTDFGANGDSILSNGAFTLDEHVTNSKAVFKKNPYYYDKKHVYFDTLERKYVANDATPDTTRLWFESGEIDSFAVSTKDTEGYIKYVKGGAEGTGTIQNPANDLCQSFSSFYDTTFVGTWNFNRTYWSNTTKTDAQKKATATAILNKDFRLAFLYGSDALAFLKYYRPDTPYDYLARAYTNRELCSAGGKDYLDYVNDVYNEKQGTTGVSLTGIDQKSDPVFNSAKASELFAKAKTSLLAAGLTEADFPIKIDVIGQQDAEYHAYEKLLTDAIEEASNGIIEINYNIASSDDENDEWIWVACNYDFSTSTGWGPDYADPKTYMHTYALGDGDNLYYMGLEEGTDLSASTIAAMSAYGITATSVDDVQELVLSDYNKLYLAADAEMDLVERYKKFALAEYSLIYEEGLCLPFLQPNGYSASVSRTVPHSAGKASYGLTSDKLKNVIVTDSVITREVKEAVEDYYNSNK